MSKLSLQTKFNILFAIFVSFVISINLMGNKVAILSGVTFSVGLLIFPFIAIIADSITEVFGQKTTKQMTYIALLCQIIIATVIYICIQLPTAPRFLPQEPAYVSIFGTSLRIILASFSAFAISAVADATIFSYLKKTTSEKLLWLRAGGSTAISALLDTAVFMVLAFYKLPDSWTFLGLGQTFGYDLAFIFQISWPYYLLKISLSWLGTPFVYLIVWWLKGGNNTSQELEKV